MKPITNIRYADEIGKVAFDYNGETVFIKEPHDVLLVGWDGADLWIKRHYWFLLSFVGE